MTCPKCGKEIRDGAKFCGHCGAKISGTPAPAPAPAKTGSRRVLLLVLALVLVLLAAAAFVFFRMRGNSTPGSSAPGSTADNTGGGLSSVLPGGSSPAASGSSWYTAFYDNTSQSYALLPMDGDHTPLPLSTIVYGDSSYDGTAGYVPEAQFSPDGKYVFFYSTDANGQNIQLLRAECSKMTTDMDTNLGLCTVVAAGWFYDSLTPLDDGTLLFYDDASSALFYFDGSSTSQILYDVSYYSLGADGYLLGSDYNSIQGVSLSAPGTTQILDDDVEYLFSIDDSGALYYKNDNLYHIGTDHTPRLLAENPTISDSSYDTLYYLTGEDGDQTLFRVKGGVVSQIAEHVMDVESDIEDTGHDIMNYITQDADSTVTSHLLDVTTGKSASITEDIATALTDQLWGEVSSAKIYITDSYIYAFITDEIFTDRFFAATLANGTARNFELISEDLHPLGQVENTVYATDQVIDLYGSSSSLETPVTLYSIKNRKAIPAASNILPASLDIYSDGTILAATGVNTHGYDYMLFRAVKGPVVLDSNIYGIDYLGNNQVLYRSMGSLYLYDGKSSKELLDYAAYFWCPTSITPALTTGIYD